MSASNSMTSDALGLEEITLGLTQTVLADDAVTTSPTVAPSTNPDEMDEIANATHPAGPEEAVEEEDLEAELDPADAAEKGKGRQTKEEEEEIDALGAAWSSCSLGDDEEARAQREAQRLQEQMQKEEEDKKRAAELAEEKRESEEYEALAKAFREHGAKAHEIKRKERKEEAARQRRLEAEAAEIALAEQRAQEERRMQEALAAQAKRDADDRVRLEMARVYERNLAERNAIAIAQANVQEAHRQQQSYEAGLIAQHNEVVARQAQLAELQRRQQEQLFLQQHWAEQHQAYPLGKLVAQSTEEATQEGIAFEGTEMDTAPEIMEASGVTEMDWEPVEEPTPLLAEPLIPSSQSMQPTIPLVAGPRAPIQELQSPGASFVGEGPESQMLQPEASSSRGAKERSIEADLTPAREAAAAKATAAVPAIPELIAEEPATVLLPPPRAVTPPLPHVSTPQLPQAATPPPPPAPMPAPASSSPMTIKIVFKCAAPSPTLAALRPTISASSPLGQLLGPQKSIPKAVLKQVLGKRVREGGEDGGLVKKKAKWDGEFRLEVGGKRKREAEVFSGSKRMMLGRILGRALAVPGSGFTASPVIASPPTLASASTPPNAPPSPSPSSSPSPPPSPSPSTSPSPSPSTPSPQLPSTPSPPPHPTGQPLPVNPHRGLAEAIELFNDLPTLRAEIEWMRAQRRLNTLRKETRGKKSPINKTIKRTAPPASYWSKYRENLSR